MFKRIKYLTIISAFASLVSSGNANIIAHAARLISLFPFAIGNIVLLGSLILFVSKKATRKPLQTSRDLLITIGILIVSDLMFYGANLVDSILISKSQKRGDEILKLAEVYKSRKGFYPQNLEVFISENIKPAIIGSSFYYFNDEKPSVRFESTMFMSCTRAIDNATWVCDD